ncbi:MAG: tRNA uridine-5-carboxymethylaminomethyl(34) synthesis GTPase MnmE [Proteobacteria bacterium]|nr:tRNA uridine-5-carboxymethylaminomethyl(34) synthesis GTPase MnmE [Pseudomonadota bacterium]
MPHIDNDTICAIATPPGRSGVGIVRVSGPLSAPIAKSILGLDPTHRYAHYSDFMGADGEVLDQGIALFFRQPESFTGEDVLELQGHGNSHVLASLRDRIISLGARLARPGEFSERAFLNNKIDLVQAEAIADLIDSHSQQAVRSALRTLRGHFSRQISLVIEKLIATRVNIEAAIDFSDEDIDVISNSKVKESLAEILNELDKTFKGAQQGAILKQGMNVVLAGKPNAGKSSLLNALSGIDSAIVTPVPGTTRDVLTEQITLDGLPLNIVDTAGLRDSTNIVEQEGVKRAKLAIDQADQILLIVDQFTYGQDGVSAKSVEKLLGSVGLISNESAENISLLKRTTLIFNKVDLVKDSKIGLDSVDCGGVEITVINISAKTGSGVELVRDHLKCCAGYNPGTEDVFVARHRHLIALDAAAELVKSAIRNLDDKSPLELLAEDLRLAQKELGAITGEFSSDDLLGEIFSTFCVGK